MSPNSKQMLPQKILTIVRNLSTLRLADKKKKQVYPADETFYYFTVPAQTTETLPSIKVKLLSYFFHNFPKHTNTR